MDEQNKTTEERTETVSAEKVQDSPQDLSDQKLDAVSGGGFGIDVLLAFGAELVKDGILAVVEAAKNNTEPYPDGTRTDIMGNQG
jgi:hypothetical protein